MLSERYKLRERMLSKKEPAPGDLKNSQPIQISKDAKISRFIVRQTCSGEKIKVVSGYFASLVVWNPQRPENSITQRAL